MTPYVPPHGASYWAVERNCTCPTCVRVLRFVQRWRKQRAAEIEHARHHPRTPSTQSAPKTKRQHGTATTYWNNGCRCQRCRDAYRRATRY